MIAEERGAVARVQAPARSAVPALQATGTEAGEKGHRDDDADQTGPTAEEREQGNGDECAEHESREPPS